MTLDADLTAAERERAFAERLAQLTPSIPPDRAPGVRPRAVVFGGQPAAGKTTMQRLVHRALGADRIALYDGDASLLVHPRYDALRRAHGIQGLEMVADALETGSNGGLHEAILAHLCAGDPRYDLLASHPLARQKWARRWAGDFRELDYRSSFVYLIVNHADSSIALAERHQTALDTGGDGGWFDPDLHDEFYAELPDTAQTLETEGLIDDIYLVDRGGCVVYENSRTVDGAWAQPPRVKQAILEERAQPPTPRSHDHLMRTAELVLKRRGLAPKVRETVERAVRRESERPEPQPNSRGRDIDLRLSVLG
ncbi:zeta toxin family protein [Kribbella sp. NPDC058245]|uniref:zeta toxin family protein n=1 Tax=Kribbella sp. NPDC058245 TaxID=3346399 RepID=UPI0036E0C201